MENVKQHPTGWLTKECECGRRMGVNETSSDGRCRCCFYGIDN